MKKLIIILITLYSFQLVKAQEFIKTKKYTIANRVDTKDKEYTTTFLEIIETKDSTKKIKRY